MNEAEALALWLTDLHSSRARMRGSARRWASDVVGDPDVIDAVERGDVAGARTAVACSTLRMWRTIDEIPARVWEWLGRLGVKVRR